MTPTLLLLPSVRALWYKSADGSEETTEQNTGIYGSTAMISTKTLSDSSFHFLYGRFYTRCWWYWQSKRQPWLPGIESLMDRIIIFKILTIYLIPTTVIKKRKHTHLYPPWICTAAEESFLFLREMVLFLPSFRHRRIEYYFAQLSIE